MRARDGGPLDLSVIPAASSGRVLLGYLGGFDEGTATIENEALDLACTLSWDLDVFPYAWLWQELGGTAGPPWLGRAYTIAIEPATSFPATGLGGSSDQGDASHPRRGNLRSDAHQPSSV